MHAYLTWIFDMKYQLGCDKLLQQVKDAAKMKVTELKKALSSRGLNTQGKKAELATRLTQAVTVCDML